TFYLARIFAILYLSSSSYSRDLHSFPTRRSSDLRTGFGSLLTSPSDHRALWKAPAWFVRRAEPSCVLPVRDRDSLPIRSGPGNTDRKSTRLNSSHGSISYAVFCLKKKKDI